MSISTAAAFCVACLGVGFLAGALAALSWIDWRRRMQASSPQQGDQQ